MWVGDAPVLLVKDRAGQVHAVEARTGGDPPGTAAAVAWCSAAQVHVSMRLGAVFAPDGRYLGGPPPAGLATYEVESAPGGVRIGDRRGGAVVSVTHVHTRLVQVGTGGGHTPPPRPPDRSVVEGDELIVFSIDLDYSDPPADLAEGAYRLRLDNRGNLPHTLVHDGLGIHLEAAGGEIAWADAHLSAGEHVLYCEIPGHRAAGMELHLTVTR